MTGELCECGQPRWFPPSADKPWRNCKACYYKHRNKLRQENRRSHGRASYDIQALEKEMQNEHGNTHLIRRLMGLLREPGAQAVVHFEPELTPIVVRASELGGVLDVRRPDGEWRVLDANTDRWKSCEPLSEPRVWNLDGEVFGGFFGHGENATLVRVLGRIEQGTKLQCRLTEVPRYDPTR